MISRRSLAAQHAESPNNVGDLIARVPLPNQRLQQIDSFLHLGHMGPQVFPPGNRGLPFGPHPCRGFETVTFIRR